ncbi:MAG: ATP phosphoribosyltransferase regulatory subunit [Azospirillaceae bacterium]|nr:ATP phosphoribosyltransferase regulatory subunit [Azospirillaceae bacterium]
MNAPKSIALLPTGLHDLLPPDAAHEAAMIERLMATFAAHGYDRVKPPLIEFEDSLLAGPGVATAQQTFRLMDPVSQRMMGVRGDITLQVARIATSRLTNVARPLRLSYAGQVLRVKGSQLRPERQFAQAGVELIGSAEPAADTEMVLLAAEALNGLGVRRLSIDLTVPTLVTTLCLVSGLDAARTAALRAAADRRDADAVAAVGGAAAALVIKLMAASGPAARALPLLAALDLPGEAANAERSRLAEVVRRVAAVDPTLQLTIDPVEHRSFEYQTGVSFTLFAHGVSGELGRGGRYRAGYDDPDGDPSTGFTLYLDTVLEAAPGPALARRVFLPLGVATAAGVRLRSEGWITIAALGAVDDPAAEARRLGCGYVLLDGVPVSAEQ